MIRIRVFGESAFEIGTSIIEPDATMAFACLLLLTSEPDRLHSRDEICALLWPDASPDKARHSLRQVIYKLNRAGAGITSTHDGVVMPSARIIADFSSTLRPSLFRLDHVLDDKPFGRYLPAYSPSIGAEFSEWLDRRRDYAQACVRRVLLTCLDDLKRQARWPDVDRVARLCILIDPLNEEATLALAEATALSGSKQEALGILSQYLEELGDEAHDIRLPANALRRRIAEQPQPDRLGGSRYAPLLGRHEEMASLSALVEECCRGNGGAILLTGDAGIGKSRILSELEAVASLARCVTVSGRCCDGDELRPFALAGSLAPQLLSAPGSLGAAPVHRARLERLYQGVCDPFSPPPSLDDPTTSASDMRRALLDVVSAIVAEVPLLLLIDDAHSIDSSSAQFLSELAARCANKPIGIVVASRPAPAPDTRPPRYRAFACLPLAGLSTQYTRSFVRHIAIDRGTSLSEDIESHIVDYSDGNPFCALEMLEQCLSTGLRAEPPASVLDLISERSERLSTEASGMLRMILVLARQCTLERLGQALEVPTDRLLRLVTELARERLVESAGSVISVRHDLIALAVQRNIEGLSLPLLHRRAAIVLESEALATHSPALTWDCITHWKLAGDFSRALSLVCSLATHLIAVGHPQVAAEHLSEAMHFAASPKEAARLRELLARALALSDQWHRAADQCDEARRTLSATPTDDSELALLSLEAMWRLGSPPLSIYAEAMTILRAPERSPKLRIGAAIWALVVADNLCSIKLAILAYREVRVLLRCASHDRSTEAHVDIIFHTNFGNIDRAAVRARELVASASEKNGAVKYCRELRHAAHVFETVGDVDRAEESLRAALDAALRNSLLGPAGAASDALCSLSLRFRSLNSAERWYLKASEYASGVDDPELQHSLLIKKQKLLLALGRRDEAAECSIVSLTTIMSDDVVRRRASALAVHARCCLPDKSEQTDCHILGALSSTYEATKRFGGQDYLCVTLFRWLTLSGESAAARKTLREYATRIRREPQPYTNELGLLFEEPRGRSSLLVT